MDFEHIRAADPEIFDCMMKELHRQRDHLELIASENFTSQAVMEAMGSHLTNKYAEGYPGRRFYGGCEYVDAAENLAIDRARALFGAEHANVQAHSGSQANVAVYLALLKPGDSVLGMDLSCGGHLTHGSPASITGKYFDCHFYGVDRETERIDYDEMLRVAKECRPKMIISGASAYPRFIDWQRIRAICDEVGAYMFVDIAHIGGLVAAGIHPSPVPYADVVTSTTHKTLRGPRGAIILCKEALAKKIDSAIFPGSQGGPLEHIVAAKAICFKEAMGEEFRAYQRQIVKNAAVLADTLSAGGVRLVSGGTDNHLMMADVMSKGHTGAEVQELLDRANITANKNTIPYDAQPPRLASGVRFGTPAATSRGMGEDEMREIGALLVRVLTEGESAVKDVRDQVIALTDRFPLYPGLYPDA
jgi:glycine hydroxymethyltransferase